MAEIEEDDWDSLIWLSNVDGFFIPLVDYWNGLEGERNSCEWPFYEKTYEIPHSNKVEEMYEWPSRSIWLSSISIFLCFTDGTRVSEGHGYSSYEDEFPLNWDSFKLLDSIDVSSEMYWKRLQKFNYVCLQDDEISELGHTIKLISAWHWNLRLHRQLEILIKLRQKAFFKPNEEMQCFFGIAKRF